MFLCVSLRVLYVSLSFTCPRPFTSARLFPCLCSCHCLSFPLVAVPILSPPPAFVTLLNGDQAQDAIRSLHHSTVRGRLINVTLQPTDSLLCLTNLPHTFTAQQFEELVRSYGNIERSFLVYSELTGHSKGYGFVEYMKKDSASRARSELLGRQQVQHDRSHHLCSEGQRLPLNPFNEHVMEFSLLSQQDITPYF